MTRMSPDIHKLQIPSKATRLLDMLARLPELMLKGGIAYAGYKAFEHPMGAVYSLLALNLARSPGVAAEAAGLAMLAHVGITNIKPVEGQHVYSSISIDQLAAAWRSPWTEARERLMAEAR